MSNEPETSTDFAKARAEAVEAAAAAQKRQAAIQAEHAAALADLKQANADAQRLAERAGLGEDVPADEIMAVRLTAKEKAAWAEHHAAAAEAALKVCNDRHQAIKALDREAANRAHRAAVVRRVKAGEALDRLRGEIEAAVVEWEATGAAVGDAINSQVLNGRADGRQAIAEEMSLRGLEDIVGAVIPLRLQTAICQSPYLRSGSAAAKVRNIYVHTYRDL